MSDAEDRLLAAARCEARQRVEIVVDQSLPLGTVVIRAVRWPYRYVRVE